MRPQGCSDLHHFLNSRDDSDDNIEDEGIMMAIQSHGLQAADSTFDNVHNEMRQLHGTTADEANNSSQNEDEGSDDYHSTFMKAAISAAIHEKGLSSENHE